MSNNFLEQLVAEYYEYAEECFVRRNVKVGKRAKGGYAGELDVVAYNPKKAIIYHIEPTMDADSWEERERRYNKKFELGRKYIPELFKPLSRKNPKIRQIMLLGYGSNTVHNEIAGGDIITVEEFLKMVIKKFKNKDIYKDAVPENFTILRTIQFMISKGLAVTQSNEVPNE